VARRTHGQRTRRPYRDGGTDRRRARLSRWRSRSSWARAAKTSTSRRERSASVLIEVGIVDSFATRARLDIGCFLWAQARERRSVPPGRQSQEPPLPDGESGNGGSFQRRRQRGDVQLGASLLSLRRARDRGDWWSDQSFIRLMGNPEESRCATAVTPAHHLARTHRESGRAVAQAAGARCSEGSAESQRDGR
jgi:hypothetical protein